MQLFLSFQLLQPGDPDFEAEECFKNRYSEFMEEKLSLILFLERKGKKARQRRQFLDTGLLLLYCPPQLTIVLDQTRLEETLQ